MILQKKETMEINYLNNYISNKLAAELLGISLGKLKKWEEERFLVPNRHRIGTRYVYQVKYINEMKAAVKNKVLAERKTY